MGPGTHFFFRFIMKLVGLPKFEPELIEQLETRQREFETQIANSDFYRQDQERIQQALKEVADNQANLERAYQRWEELEG